MLVLCIVSGVKWCVFAVLLCFIKWETVYEIPKEEIDCCYVPDCYVKVQCTAQALADPQCHLLSISRNFCNEFGMYLPSSSLKL